VARRMDHNRAVHQKLALLLETSQAEVISGIVDVMYRQVTPAGIRESKATNATESRETLR